MDIQFLHAGGDLGSLIRHLADAGDGLAHHVRTLFRFPLGAPRFLHAQPDLFRHAPHGVAHVTDG